MHTYSFIDIITYDYHKKYIQLIHNKAVNITIASKDLYINIMTNLPCLKLFKLARIPNFAAFSSAPMKSRETSTVDKFLSTVEKKMHQ